MCGNDAVISKQLQQVNNVIVVLPKVTLLYTTYNNVTPVIRKTRCNGSFLL